MTITLRIILFFVLGLALNGCALLQWRNAPPPAESLVENTKKPTPLPAYLCVRTERNLLRPWVTRYYWCHTGDQSRATGLSVPAGTSDDSASTVYPVVTYLPPAAHPRRILSRVPVLSTSRSPGSTFNPSIASSAVRVADEHYPYVPDNQKTIWFAKGLRVLGPDGRRRTAILAETLRNGGIDKRTIWLRGSVRKTELSADDRSAIDQLSVDRALAVRQALRQHGLTARIRIRKPDGVFTESTVVVSVL